MTVPIYLNLMTRGNEIQVAMMIFSLEPALTVYSEQLHKYRSTDGYYTCNYKAETYIFMHICDMWVRV